MPYRSKFDRADLVARYHRDRYRVVWATSSVVSPVGNCVSEGVPYEELLGQRQEVETADAVASGTPGVGLDAAGYWWPTEAHALLALTKIEAALTGAPLTDRMLVRVHLQEGVSYDTLIRRCTQAEAEYRARKIGTPIVLDELGGYWTPVEDRG